MDAPRSSPGYLISRGLPLAVITGLAIANGMTFSPLYDFASYFLYSFTRRTFFYNPVLLFYLPSVLITLLTLMFAGVPAALYERIRGAQQSTPASIGIWLVATLLLTAPALSTLVSED